MSINRRTLDSTETFFYEANATPRFTMEYDGELDAEVLTSAFKELCSRHPVLRANIETVGSQYTLTVGDHTCPQTEVFDGRDETWAHESSLEKWSKWRESSSDLVRLALFPARNSGRIMVCIDHTIVDGAALVAYIVELWKLYEQILDGTLVPAEPSVSLPPSPSDILLDRWGVDHLDLDIQSSEQSRISDIDNADDLIDYVSGNIRLSPETTESLVVTARQRRLTFGSLLVGEFAVALRGSRQFRPAGPRTIGTVVNLRKHVSPPVGKIETTSFCARTKSAVNASGADDATRIAIDFKTNLAHSITHRRLAFPGLRLPYSHFDVYFNSSGVFPTLYNTGRLRVADVYLAGLAPGDRNTVQVPRSASSPAALTVFGFGGTTNLIYGCRMELESRLFDFVEKLQTL